jgi:hypothetical protein
MKHEILKKITFFILLLLVSFVLISGCQNSNQQVISTECDNWCSAHGDRFQTPPLDCTCTPTPTPGRTVNILRPK